MLACAALLAGCAPNRDPPTIARAALTAAPLFDGHNDLAIHFARATPNWSLRKLDLANLPGQSSLAHWRAGRVGGALVTTSSIVEPGAAGQFASLMQSLDWFDALVAKHGADVAKVASPAEWRAARASGRIALVMAVEGGHQIEGDLTNLRSAQARGVRSIGIVYNEHGAIGDGAAPTPGGTPSSGGLTPFGRAVITEMNRLGLIVDLSHAAETTATQAIRHSRAPILFSHSGARAITDHPRNLSDGLLRRVGQNDGLVMVPLVPYFVSSRYAHWWNSGEQHYAQLNARFPNSPDQVREFMGQWDRDNPAPNVTIGDVADHIEHVARLAGHDHVGIGSDFDGMGSHVIPSLATAAALPDLFTELARRGWSQRQLEQLSSRNFERFWERVERAARR